MHIRFLCWVITGLILSACSPKDAVVSVGEYGKDMKSKVDASSSAVAKSAAALEQQKRSLEQTSETAHPDAK